MSDDFFSLCNDIHSMASLGRQEGSGFYTVYCPVCGKSTRKTGGFKFESETIVYNCFRGSCDASCVYTMGEPVSRKFKNLMSLYGVKIPVNLLIKKSSLSKQIEVLDKELYEKHRYNEIDMPENCVLLEKAKGSSADYWVDYYQARNVPLKDIFLFEKGTYQGNTMIAMFYFDKLIGYQIVFEDKYLTFTKGNTNLLYIPERTLEDTVILVEGTLDAKSVPFGVATLNDKVSPQQAYFLRNKNVIMVPDKKSNNYLNQFSKYGWSISFPEWDVHDVNAAAIKYGTIVTMEKIMSGIVKNKKEAEIKYKLWIQKYGARNQ